MFVKATYYRDKKTVHYFDEKGNETLYIGGSFAWRMNNPGNIGKPGKRVISTYIGLAQRTDEPYLFLIFPDKKTGDMERARLLKDVYGKSTILGMMESYAPKKHGNDPAAYTAMITKETGIPASAIVGQLNDAQFAALLKVMQKKEGYIPGQIIELGKPAQVTLKDKLKQPMADQKIQIKGATKSVDVKTDEHGAVPPVYSKLLGGEAELVHVQSSCTSEKIGKVSCGSAAKSTTFSAPYFLSKSNPNVHKVEEKAERKVHIVKAGESLTSIASQYPGATVEEFVKENGLKDANKIYERQHLRIPGRGGSGSAEHGGQPAAPTQAARTSTPAQSTASTATTATTSKPASATTSPPQQSGATHKPAATQTSNHPSHAAQGPAQQKPASSGAEKADTKAPAQTQKKQPPPKPAPKTSVAVDQQRTEKNHPVTVLSTPTLEPSGAQWYSRFMGSNKLEDLNEKFRPGATAFVAAMRAAKIQVTISVTYRPIERSYLMYHAFTIAKGGSPVGVEAWPGVKIDWAHRGADGKPDLAAAKQAAIDMCKKYGLKLNSAKQKVGKPKQSRHNAKAAIDMKISGHIGATVVDNTGAKIKIKDFKTLVTVGKTYGVKYYPAEDMHWSDTGH
jgi:hypothetical protein